MGCCSSSPRKEDARPPRETTERVDEGKGRVEGKALAAAAAILIAATALGDSTPLEEVAEGRGGGGVVGSVGNATPHSGEVDSEEVEGGKEGEGGGLHGDGAGHGDDAGRRDGDGGHGDDEDGNGDGDRAQGGGEGGNGNSGEGHSDDARANGEGEGEGGDLALNGDEGMREPVGGSPATPPAALLHAALGGASDPAPPPPHEKASEANGMPKREKTAKKRKKKKAVEEESVGPPVRLPAVRALVPDEGSSDEGVPLPSTPPRHWTPHHDSPSRILTTPCGSSVSGNLPSLTANVEMILSCHASSPRGKTSLISPIPTDTWTTPQRTLHPNPDLDPTGLLTTLGIDTSTPTPNRRGK